MDTRNLRGDMSALPASWVGIGYLTELEWTDRGEVTRWSCRGPGLQDRSLKDEHLQPCTERYRSGGRLECILKVSLYKPDVH
ncbi:hypothetical protein EVAR_49381_1 [Eumeta japonica]|uniref:Uncharacterized protein n=1 Tax=Eumeta variegata TaxID=151549 RepID=A0A4C1YQB0_EUMVA|nr:hypothetical protein EVAR_49381_1 [Eumeta japonica]